MPAPPQPRVLTAAGAAWAVALVAAGLAIAGVVFAASQRVGYPHELEWMEGALADHAWRVAHGLPLYCEPGPEHVPFLYAPLLFWLGALAIGLGIEPVLALRLIALGCTLATMLLLGHWVRRDGGRVVPGLVAAGLFAAGYGWLAWWYDLARNDTLFVLLCVATAWQLRHGGHRRWLPAALLATAALLAKQSALMWLPAVAVGAAIVDWRVAARFVAATAVLGGAALGALHAGTDGWSTFYLFEMPRHHGWVGDAKLGFWRDDIVWLTPLLLLGLAGCVARCRAGDARGALFLAAFGSGALATSWLSRLHVGGFDNVLVYAFAGACLLGPIAAARATGRWAVAAVLLLVAQFTLLGVAAWQRGAATLWPSPAHRRAHEELAAFVAAQPGPVWLPGHGAISTRAGTGTGAHGQAIFDLLQVLPRLPDGLLDLDVLASESRSAALPPRARTAMIGLLDRCAAALRQQRFAAIVVDDVGTGTFGALFAVALAGADGVAGTADDPYARSPGFVVHDPAAIRPLVGYAVHSPYALVRR